MRSYKDDSKVSHLSDLMDGAHNCDRDSWDKEDLMRKIINSLWGHTEVCACGASQWRQPEDR